MDKVFRDYPKVRTKVPERKIVEKYGKWLKGVLKTKFGSKMTILKAPISAKKP